jgi:heme A synthase
VYAIALTAVRVRGMRVSCHCFGANAAKVSWYDVARNGLLIVGAVAGAMSVTGSGRPSVTDAVLIGMIALAAALILINLADVMDTARKAGEID